MEATTLATVIADIGSVVTGLLGFIPDVFAAIFEIAILKYALYAGFAAGIIYFVPKLVKRVGGRRKI